MVNFHCSTNAKPRLAISAMGNLHCVKGLEGAGNTRAAGNDVLPALIVSPIRQCVERTSPEYSVNARIEHLDPGIRSF